MDEIITAQTMPFEPIGEQQLTKLIGILERYRNGKKSLDDRVISAEQWYKLRNREEEAKDGHYKGGFMSRSAWLHNVIVSKHADAMEAYPEPDFLPRERGDKAEAMRLSKIVPCILEQNGFEQTYSDNGWGKCKFGTAVYKVTWDKSKLNGLGDVSITRCNVLNLFWEPGVDDIQQSKYFFEVDFQDEDEVKAAFPEAFPDDRSIPKSVYTSKFRYDDSVDTTDKVPVISCYYKQRGVLQYILFVPGTVLAATENDPAMAERGLYDHGLYPYVFDALYPIEGSPCGYGYVDVCRNPQTEIDLIKTALVENTMAGAKPRYFVTEAAGINDDEFLDANSSLVHLSGGIIGDSLQPVIYNPLNGNYINVLEQVVQELRETSGNTETSTGNTSSGVTAASAIAALQEASGKGSRDASMASYRAYSRMCEMVVELVRQFYDMPREFRILGQDGEEMFVSYSNAGLQPQMQYTDSGIPVGLRKPVFDIKIVPQKRSAYTKMANNDLALQLYGLGFFNPQLADQAVACLTIMDFDSKDELLRIVQRNGDMYQRYQLLVQFAAALAAKYGDAQAMSMLQQLSAVGGGVEPQPTMQQAQPVQQDVGGAKGRMDSARQRSRAATMPEEGGIA